MSPAVITVLPDLYKSKVYGEVYASALVQQDYYGKLSPSTLESLFGQMGLAKGILYLLQTKLQFNILDFCRTVRYRKITLLSTVYK